MTTLNNMNFVKLFSNVNFRYLWLARTISYCGDSLYNITLMWFVFNKTGSSFQVGLILVAKFLPELLFGMIFGVWIDKWNKKKLMQISDLIQAMTTGILAVMIATDTFQLYFIYIITIILSLSNNIFGTSQVSILPELVEKEKLVTANSLISISNQTARLLGATVGGILIALTGEAYTIAIDSGTFILSLICIQFIKYFPTTTQRISQKQSIFADISEGINWLKKQKILVLLIILGTLSNIALGPSNVLPPMLIKNDFQTDAAALGIFDSFIAFGLLIGGILVSMISPIKIGLWFSSGLALQCAGVLIISLSPNLFLANVGNLVLGVAIIFTIIPMSTLFQVMIPSNMRGRVNSVSSIAFNISIPITYGFIGMLADQIGAKGCYGIASAILCLCATLAFSNKILLKYTITYQKNPG